MKIAHISDLHICSTNKRTNIRNCKLVLDYIAKNNFDHIIITGDITDNAERKDYEIIRKLLEKYKFLDNDKLSVVIGNHDIFGGVHKAEDILNFPSKCKKVNYNKKIKEFGEYFVEAFWKTYHPNKDDLFPFAKDLGNVVLVGINSIDQYSKIKNPFASNGRISKGQYNGLIKIFEEENYQYKPIIILIHHHFYRTPILRCHSELSLLEKIEKHTIKLRKKKKLLKLLCNKNVKLILHGHLHESCDYQIKGLRFLNAGATFSLDHEITINEIEINKGSVSVSINKISELERTLRISNNIFRSPQHANAG